jgi:hypothetical protein
MVHGVILLVLGACLILLGAVLGGAGWLLVWTGGCFLALAAAYAGLGPGILGKQVNGSRAWWALVLWMPYFLLTWLAWHLERLWSGEEWWHEFAPGLWLGRRPWRNSLPPGINLIVDLRAEFAASRKAIAGRTYFCLPTLDTSVPNVDAFVELVRKVMAWNGAVYIYCASGHGRSATVAAAVLIGKGLAKDVHQAEEMLRQVRPGVRLKKVQRALVKQVTTRFV